MKPTYRVLQNKMRTVKENDDEVTMYLAGKHVGGGNVFLQHYNALTNSC